jgi:hypothetical protein
MRRLCVFAVTRLTYSINSEATVGKLMSSVCLPVELPTLYETDQSSSYPAFERHGFSGDDAKCKDTVERLNTILANVYRRDKNVWRGRWRLTKIGSRCKLKERDPIAGAYYMLASEPLARTTSSTIFLADVDSFLFRGTPMPKKVIVKYTNTCNTSSPRSDDLLIEYLVMKVLMDRGIDIAPKVYSISTPVVPSQDDWGKDARFRASENRGASDPERCYKKRAIVRALVEEKIDTDLAKHVSLEKIH